MIKIVYDRTYESEVLKNSLAPFTVELEHPEVSQIMNQVNQGLQGINIFLVHGLTYNQTFSTSYTPEYTPNFGTPMSIDQEVNAIVNDQPSRIISHTVKTDNQARHKNRNLVIGPCLPLLDEKILLIVLPIRKAQHELSGNCKCWFNFIDSTNNRLIVGLQFSENSVIHIGWIDPNDPDNSFIVESYSWDKRAVTPGDKIDPEGNWLKILDI